MTFFICTRTTAAAIRQRRLLNFSGCKCGAYSGSGANSVIYGMYLPVITICVTLHRMSPCTASIIAKSDISELSVEGDQLKTTRKRTDTRLNSRVISFTISALANVGTFNTPILITFKRLQVNIKKHKHSNQISLGLTLNRT